MQLLSPGYFCWYSRTTYRATCCCGSTAGIQFRSCAVCPADHGHACRKTRCRKLYVFRGFRFRDCIGRILAGLLVKYRGYDDMFLGMLLVLLLSIVLHYLFGRRHPSSPPPPKKKEYGMNRITRKSDIFGRICFKPTYLIYTINNMLLMRFSFFRLCIILCCSSYAFVSAKSNRVSAASVRGLVV